MKTLTLNPIDGLEIKCLMSFHPTSENLHVGYWELEDWTLHGDKGLFLNFYAHSMKANELPFNFIHRLCCEEIERQRELSNEP